MRSDPPNVNCLKNQFIFLHGDYFSSSRSVRATFVWKKGWKYTASEPQKKKCKNWALFWKKCRFQTLWNHISTIFDRLEFLLTPYYYTFFSRTKRMHHKCFVLFTHPVYYFKYTVSKVIIKLYLRVSASQNDTPHKMTVRIKHVVA